MRFGSRSCGDLKKSPKAVLVYLALRYTEKKGIGGHSADTAKKMQMRNHIFTYKAFSWVLDFVGSDASARKYKSQVAGDQTGAKIFCCVPGRESLFGITL